MSENDSASTHSADRPADFSTTLSTAFHLVGIDTVPEPALALLAARVTTPNLSIQSILASLCIDRRIRAPLILHRPVDAIGAGFHFVWLPLALRRTGRNAQSGAHLVGEGVGSGESRAGRARGDAVLLAVACGLPRPLRAVRPIIDGSRHDPAIILIRKRCWQTHVDRLLRQLVTETSSICGLSIGRKCFVY
jgi:hypothetical protein